MDFVKLNVYDEEGNIKRTIQKPILMKLFKRGREIAVQINKLVNETEDRMLASVKVYDITSEFIFEIMGVTQEEKEYVYPKEVTACYQQIINSANNPL